jgi:asparagine synthase (glutamine-hydrolysing)
MLPSIVIDRPKIGFAIPMAQWFKGSQRLASFLSILDEPNAYITNYLNRKQINILIDDFNRGRADRIRYLWILLALELWLKEISNIRYAR